MTVAELVTRGMQLLQAGQASEAEQIFISVLAQDAEHLHARFALGIACYQLNKFTAAERNLSASIARHPEFLPAYNNLGLVYKAMEDPGRAITILRRVLEIQPGYVDAIYNLALILADSGDRNEAMQSYRRVIALKPDFFRAHTNLGLLLRAEGDPAAAHRHLDIVAKRYPEDAAAQVNLTLVLTDLARYADAISIGGHAAQLEADNFSVWEALGNAQRLAGDAHNAVTSFERAHALNPDSVELNYELGLAQYAAGDILAGRATLNAVGRSRPDWLKVWFTRDLALPLLYMSEQHIADSNAGFVAGIENIEARILGDDQWSVEEAVAAVSGYTPFYLHYQGIDNTQLQRRFGHIVGTVCKRAWPQFADPVPWQPLAHGGRLRVGFISAYLRRHSVGLFFGNWICQLDAQKIESFVWHTGESSDTVTENIRAHAAHFTHTVSDVGALARTIHASRLDILIFLDVGMHPHSQMLAALQLAPVQCASFGHPVTTGIEGISYFLSADAAEPPNAPQHYTEKLILLPGFAVNYPRPVVSGQQRTGSLASPRRTLVLCAQPLFKILPHFDRLAARIVREIPGCRLVFFASLWPRVNNAFSERISGALREVGVDPEQTLEILPIVPYAAYLDLLATADVVLDTPGFSGGNSSFDAIAVGAPICSLRGAMLRGRQTSAMLDIVGLSELACESDDDYVRSAVNLASSRDRQKDIYDRLITGGNALFDKVATVRALEVALFRLVT